MDQLSIVHHKRHPHHHRHRCHHRQGSHNRIRNQEASYSVGPHVIYGLILANSTVGIRSVCLMVTIPPQWECQRRIVLRSTRLRLTGLAQVVCRLVKCLVLRWTTTGCRRLIRNYNIHCSNQRMVRIQHQYSARIRLFAVSLPITSKVSNAFQ